MTKPAKKHAPRTRKVRRASQDDLARALTALLDLPFRSDRPHRAPAPRAKRAARAKPRGLPFASQTEPGAQLRGNDCGPACVRMALDFLKLAPGETIDAMAQEVDPADDGTTWDDLVRLARARGANAVALDLGPNELPPAPAILLVRYTGFRRESVEDTRYWDAVDRNPNFLHWLWWLGNVTVDGRQVSVWNDPLYRGQGGKNVLHSVDELNGAFIPVGGRRRAVHFPDIANVVRVPERLQVFAFGADGVNLRSEPSTSAGAATVVASLPQGHVLTTAEPAANVVDKLAHGGGANWLAVRTDVDGTSRDGFVAAWLVRLADGPATAPIAIPGTPPASVPPPPAPYTWQHVINAAALVATRARQSWQEWLTRAGVLALFVPSLRGQPYTGPAPEAWPLTPEHRAQVLEALQLAPEALVAEVVRAQAEMEAEAATVMRTGAKIGIHGPPGIGAPPRGDWDDWIGMLKDMGVRWYKQCDDGDVNHRAAFEWCQRLKQEGIEPILRYLVDRQFPHPMPGHYFDKMHLYAAAGMRWAEIGNEPNLGYEWKQDWEHRANTVGYNDPEIVRLLAANWVADSRRALDAGAWPALYALGPTDWNGGTHPTLSSATYSQRIAAELAERHRAATLDIFARGGWIAVHAATFEFPDDFDPWRTPVWDQALRSYEVMPRMLERTFGPELSVARIPVLSTEGGVYTPESTSMGGHARLPSDQAHAERVVSMFKWLEANSSLTAMCPWCLTAHGMGGPFDARFDGDGWVRVVNGARQARPVVEAMKRWRASLNAAPRGISAAATAAIAAMSPDLQRRLIEVGIDAGSAKPQKRRSPRKKPRRPARE